MTSLVPAEEIEEIVGARRHLTKHLARAVSDEQTVYILHSHQCRDNVSDLRVCRYSVALDQGIDGDDWMDHEDETVRVTINRSGRLIPVVPGMKVAR